MDSAPRRRTLLLGVTVALALLAGALAAYFFWPRLPAPGSPKYLAYLRAFQVGVAALDTDRKDIALAKLSRAIELVPAEPAGWANRGLLYSRKNQAEDLEQAARDLQTAHQLAPESGAIAALRGHLAEKQGRLPEAIAFFRTAVESEPRDLTSLYALAEAVRKTGGAGSDTEYRDLLERILAIQPNNLFVLSDRIRLALQANDPAGIEDVLGRMDRLAPSWNIKTRKKLTEVRQAAKKSVRSANVPVLQFCNVLMSEHGFSRDAATVKPKSDSTGLPVEQFLRLAPPRATPAPPDHALTFAVAAWEAGAEVKESRWDMMQTLWIVNDAERSAFLARPRGGIETRSAGTYRPMAIVANAQEIRRADGDGPALPFPGGKQKVAPTAAGLLSIDWNNDFRTDLLAAGAGGLRFYQQQPNGSFADVTAQTGLSPSLVEEDYYGAWAVDIDTDGDLDVIVARRSGAPLLLRNNRDGTFKEVPMARFAAVAGARAFIWADLDNDGAADAVFLDAAGRMHVFANERAGLFAPWPLPDDLGKVLAVTVADVNDDGVFDLVALRDDGTVLRVSDTGHRKAWATAPLAQWRGPKDAAPGDVALFAEDLDNNGAADLVVAGPNEAHVFLADTQFKHEPLAAVVPLHVFAIASVEGGGRLDLLGISAAGRPVQATNQGRKDYHWQMIWTVGNLKDGDGRNSTFGIGADIEIRAGMLVMKKVVKSPATHFGLGDQESINVARLVWPNGVPNWEFEPPAEPVIVAVQRIVSSCPFLFADDGTGMRFVADFMWNTPLGMHVNGFNTTAAGQTTEWLKVRGDQLAPRDGYYELRAHANLWETDYFDQLGLIVVDHPPDTEIYVDERFVPAPKPPVLTLTRPAVPVARAWDHHGADVTDIVHAIDGRYLDRCGRGPFQGVTEDHWVEVQLGDDVPKAGPVYLIARGWTHPTDSSINVAIAQGKHAAPRGLVLEVPDGKGGWRLVLDGLGFPAGKNKTAVIRLDGIDGPGVPRRFRLRTNMEIFWDYLGYAEGLDAGAVKMQRPLPQTAELRYRGILAMTQKDASSPEVPHYDKVTHGQLWRDLTGFYTRYGDVRELLAKVDDRYVIANAGDEIALRYPVPAGPPVGWRRDFIWECDGWTRDGNPNTLYGTTVLPLPAHDLKQFAPPTGRLADDPVYQRPGITQDWTTYHTRFVTADEFARGLRTFRRPGR